MTALEECGNGYRTLRTQDYIATVRVSGHFATTIWCRVLVPKCLRLEVFVTAETSLSQTPLTRFVVKRQIAGLRVIFTLYRPTAKLERIYYSISTADPRQGWTQVMLLVYHSRKRQQIDSTICDKSYKSGVWLEPIWLLHVMCSKCFLCTCTTRWTRLYVERHFRHWKYCSCSWHRFWSLALASN